MATLFTPQSINSGTFSGQTVSTSGQVSSVAGQYYGFGAFTYSGGQIITQGTAPVFTAQGINTAIFTGQTVS